MITRPLQHFDNHIALLLLYLNKWLFHHHHYHGLLLLHVTESEYFQSYEYHHHRHILQTDLTLCYDCLTDHLKK